jgi:hypothetical protein
MVCLAPGNKEGNSISLTIKAALFILAFTTIIVMITNQTVQAFSEIAEEEPANVLMQLNLTFNNGTNSISLQQNVTEEEAGSIQTILLLAATLGEIIEALPLEEQEPRVEERPPADDGRNASNTTAAR